MVYAIWLMFCLIVFLLIVIRRLLHDIVERDAVVTRVLKIQSEQGDSLGAMKYLRCLYGK